MTSTPLLIVLYLAGGAVAGAVFIRFAVAGTTVAARRLASGLLIAAFIYVAFAMAAMKSKWLLVELGGLVLFGAFVYLGLRRSVVWLAAGWALHIVWDVALHTATGVEFVPEWYPIACMSFDLVVAAYVLRAVPIARAPV